MSIVLVLLLLFLPGVVWLLLAVTGTIGWSLSGEAGALLHCGFVSGGRRLRRTVALQTVLGHVALAARLNMPLPSALRAAARGETDRVAKSLKSMVYLLGIGWPVSEAIHGGLPGCPPLIVAILRKGERCGQLAPALTDVERMLGDATRGGSDESNPFAHAATYGLVMLIFCLLIMMGISVSIIPKFKAIFLDFDTELPEITISLMNVFDWLVIGPGLLLLCALGALIVLTLTVGCVASFSRVVHTEKPPLLLRVIGALRWMIPVTRNIDFGLGMATASRTLLLGLRTGLSLDRAVDLAATVGAANHLRYRLADFAEDVRGGVSPRIAAKSAGLGDVFSSALAMIERGEDAETALTHAADYYQAVASRWWQALSAVSGPAVTLLVAALVGYLALALFLPLIELINSVSESIA